MAISPTTLFTSDKAKAALNDIIAAFSLPENVIKINEAKTAAGNDMLMHMQLVFPLATQIQMEVIQNHGFNADKDGLLQFTHAVQSMQKESEEIALLNEQLRHLLLPQVTLPYAKS